MNKIKNVVLLIFSLFAIPFLLAQNPENLVESDHAPNEFLIQLIDNQAIKKVSDDFQKDKITFQKVDCLSEHIKIWHLKFDEKLDEKALFSKLQRHPSVLVVQLNHYAQFRNTTPNDPQFNSQWQWQNTGQTGGKAGADISATRAWDITTGGMTTDNDTIVVAVIDSGTDFNHPDLLPNRWVNWKEIPNNGIDDDNNGFVDDFRGWNSEDKNDNVEGGTHGLEVEGMVGGVGNNNRGGTGINWKVKIMSVLTGGLESEIVAAYNYVMVQRMIYNASNGKQGAYVVASNSSFGDTGFAATHPLWCAAYDSMGRVGILSAGSTDNSNKNVDLDGDIPSTCPSDYLIVVTSTDKNDVKASDGAFGVTHVDVAAPGVSILTTSNNGNYGTNSGTSFSAPIVAGLVALAYSTQCTDFTNFSKTNPSQAALFLKNKILQSVDEIPSLVGKIKTGGRVNAFKSLQGLQTFCSNCLQPSSINIEPTTASVKVNMKVPTGVSIKVQYRKTGTTVWTVLNNPTIPLSISGLEKCGDYDLEITSVCSGNVTSNVFSTVFKSGGCCVNPAKINVSNVKENQFTVSFPKVDVADNYTLCLKDPSNGNCISTQIITDTAIIFNGLSICKNYNLNINATCGAQKLGPSVFSAKTGGCGPCSEKEYCFSRSNNSNLEWIDSIAIGTANLKTGKNGGYFRLDSVLTTLKSGLKYKFTVKPGYASSIAEEAVRIWIDFNGNGNFNDAGDKIFETLKLTSAKTDSFIMPQIILNQVVRMRVSMKFVGATTNPTAPSPCDTLEDGEVEDYCVKLEGVSSLSSLPQTDFSVYPNPFSNTLTIQKLNQETQFRNVQILSLDGRILLNQTLQNVENEYVITPKEPLSMGIYFLKIETDKGVLVKKIVKM
jgi:serine protease